MSLFLSKTIKQSFAVVMYQEDTCCYTYTLYSFALCSTTFFFFFYLLFFFFSKLPHFSHLTLPHRFIFLHDNHSLYRVHGLCRFVAKQ